MLRLSIALCLVAAVAARARAQEPAPDAGPSESPETPAPVLVPPRVVSLPEVVLPEDADVPEDGVVELELAIDADARATVTACGAAEAVCERVREAIAGGTFDAATRDGQPIAARIAMRFRIRHEEVVEEVPLATETGPAAPAAEPEEARPPAQPSVVEDTRGFGVVARVERPPAGVLRLELEEMRDMPGAFGDPFRAIEALPGVTPILSGLPYFYVRGSPPSGTIYIYDDIPLPALYHLGLGPSVVHARMIGPLRLYSGVPPARFGRLIGGVIEAEGPEPPDDDRVHGEAELRLLDVTGFVEAPLGEGGRIAVAGRYGYPGLLLSIFSPEVDLAYWDYQLRFEHPIGRRDRVEVVWLGSYDSLTTVQDAGTDDEETSSLVIQFHRLETRLVRTLDDLEIGTALRVGWEESGLDEEVSIQAFTLGPRMWIEHVHDRTRVRIGAEMIGAAGHMRFTPDEPGGGGPGGGGDAPQDPSRNEAYASVAARSITSLYGELAFDPVDVLTLDLGLRMDAWATGTSVEAALDPRVRGTLHASEDVDLHLAVGVARQPAVFFIPLPGLTEVAVDRGLQTAAQGELGVAAEPLDGHEIEAQIFVHRYSNLLFPDLFAGGDVCVDDDGACREIDPPPRVDGISYGMEVFARRDVSHRLAGFLSYTLAFAELDAIPGIEYTPSYDVRHIVNVAGRWHLGGGFSTGARVHFRTGKPAGEYYLDTDALAIRRYEQRLPPFFRLDAQVAYGWRTSWGSLRLALEWFNVTFSREPLGMECQDPLVGPPAQECPVEYTPAIVVPSLGLRGTF